MSFSDVSLWPRALRTGELSGGYAVCDDIRIDGSSSARTRGGRTSSGRALRATGRVIEARECGRGGGCERRSRGGPASSAATRRACNGRLEVVAQGDDSLG